jgi:uncharacterized membrane protein YvlD (DUF360 family)
MLMLVSEVVPGFVITSFWSAFWGAIIVSFVSWIVNIFVGGDGKVVFIKKVHKNDDHGA